MREICSYCCEKLPSLESCTCKSIRYGSETVPRIRFGDEEYDWGTRRCAGCGVLLGGYHHENCACEICPMCGEQVLLCACDTDFVIQPLRNDKFPNETMLSYRK